MTQQQRIREYLESDKVLTRLNAWDELGILKAPERIGELRKQGIPIVKKMVTVSNRYKEKANVSEWSAKSLAR